MSPEVQEESEISVVFKRLLTVGCCQMCCLRFVGETIADSYKDLPKHVEKITNNSLESLESCRDKKLQKPNPCITCLGLLQKPTCDEIVQQVLEELKCKDYDSGTFNVAITLPVAFQLRSHSMWIFMQENFPTFTLKALPIGCVTVGVKDVWKWLFTPLIEEETKKKFNVDSDLFVGINISYEENDNECSCLYDMVPEIFSRKTGRRKKEDELFSRKAVEHVFKTIQSSLFKIHFPVPPNIPLKIISCGSVTFQHNSIFIAGRYNKWSRELPQTPWIIGGERKMENSVQEYICGPLEEVSHCEGLKFGASGREDVDVRMLGRGRPFSVELLNPKKTKLSQEALSFIQALINKKAKGKVSVRDLQLSSKESLLVLKTGEEKKTKVYSAFCVLFGPFPESCEEISKKFPLQLLQKTPIRVLHRRPVATRIKTVHWLKINKIFEGEKHEAPSYFTLKISTQAGTYIKEFIHGDFGRTNPSLGQLLGNVDVDILALDVQEISLDWPPSID